MLTIGFGIRIQIRVRLRWWKWANRLNMDLLLLQVCNTISWGMEFIDVKNKIKNLVSSRNDCDKAFGKCQHTKIIPSARDRSYITTLSTNTFLDFTWNFLLQVCNPKNCHYRHKSFRASQTGGGNQNKLQWSRNKTIPRGSYTQILVNCHTSDQQSSQKNFSPQKRYN